MNFEPNTWTIKKLNIKYTLVKLYCSSCSILASPCVTIAISSPSFNIHCSYLLPEAISEKKASSAWLMPPFNELELNQMLFTLGSGPVVITPLLPQETGVTCDTGWLFLLCELRSKSQRGVLGVSYFPILIVSMHYDWWHLTPWSEVGLKDLTPKQTLKLPTPCLGHPGDLGEGA